MRHHPTREIQRIVEDKRAPLTQEIREGFLERKTFVWFGRMSSVWGDDYKPERPSVALYMQMRHEPYLSSSFPT